jgi:hypothetical protein
VCGTASRVRLRFATSVSVPSGLMQAMAGRGQSFTSVSQYQKSV